MKRDLTHLQFVAALEKHGFGQPEALGYVDLGIPGHHIAASILNGGRRRRDQLAYLERERRKQEKRLQGKRQAVHA